MTALDRNECQALQYLQAAGWTVSDLSLAFGVGEDALLRHLHRECDHDPLHEPMDVEIPAGDEIRDARQAAGMTQADVGDAVGVVHSAVSAWERGERVPRPDQARRLRDVLPLDE